MTRRVASPAIRASLRGYEPSDEQWEAIEHPAIPVAIIAGAGAGKTAIMAARIVWMVEQDLYRPSQILGLTFTNKAALELEERIIHAFAAMDPQPPESPGVSTYNSFADRLVREHGVRIGIDPDVGLLSQAQSWQLLLEAFSDLPPFDAIESRSMGTVMRNALGLADACANHLVTPERIIEEDERIVADADSFDEDIVRASAQRIELARVVRAYIEIKRRTQRIDFGDQVTQAVAILETFPEVARELQQRYPALLLDEYQDTNIAQRRLLQLLAPTGHNVTAVGDARQNIFQWRGSTLFNLIDFPKSFLRDGELEHEYLSLSENYRSGGKILAVANRVIESVPSERRPGKPLRPHEANSEGSVVAGLLSDQYAEASFIADEISRWHGRSTAPGREPVAWNDVAILVRRRAHIAAIYHALRERDIPVEVVGLAGLLQVPEIVDTIAWLRVVADPGPSSNRWLARILLGPRFRIHYRDLASLARWAGENNIALTKAKRDAQEAGNQTHIVPKETELEPEDVAFSLTEALEHLDAIAELPPEARRRLEQARREIESLRRMAGGALLELVQSVVVSTGIQEALESSIREDAKAARANVTNFLGAVASFAPISGDPSLSAFLAYLDAAEDVEETLDLATPAAGDSVKLMTVHQAKGLEFELVFVPCVAARTNDDGNLVDSIFPDTRTSNPMTSYGQLPPSVREDAMHLPSPWTLGQDGIRVAKKKNDFRKELIDRAIEDERRLFYVAITRAKQRLYVTCAWWYERQGSERGPSLFFREVEDAPETECLPPAEQPADNPLQQLLAQRAVWPPAEPATIKPDELFPEGYPVTVERLLEGTITQEDVLSVLDDDARTAARAIAAQHLRDLAHLETIDALRSAGATHARRLSATRAVQVASLPDGGPGPARPMPERPSPARRIGTEIHKWIEEQGRGLSGIADEEALDIPAAHVDKAQIVALRKAFNEMGYPARTLAQLDSGEPMAEVAFVLKAGDTLVRGRIDAVYKALDHDGLEVVDFKTGGEVEVPEIDQLIVYAGALTKLGLNSDQVTLTYAYLSNGETRSRTIASAEAEAALAELGDRLARVPAGA